MFNRYGVSVLQYEKVLKVDLPDDILEKIVEVVKTKINVDDAKETLGKIAGLFGKD